MIQRFKEYFTYTNKERNGVIVLLIFLIFLVSLRVYQKNKSYGEITIMDEEFKKDILAFENSLQQKNTPKFKKRINSKGNNQETNDQWQKSDNLFYFDPNKVSKSELRTLGFTNKQISTLTNYREKGGKFFDKEDLLKIYGIEEEQYKYLEEYILIEQDNRKKEENTKNDVEIKKLIEVNTASEDELMKLTGIGVSYASRIIKYRNLLGGFINKEQLLEIYGFDSIRYEKMKNEISIDTSMIKKLDLNNANYKQLIKHPYLNQYQTESILKYRELMGNFSGLEQIYQNNLLTKEDFLRLKPYLKLK